MSMIDIEKTIETYTPEQLAVLKHRLETNYLDHAKFFLALRENQPFIMGQHHPLIADTMQAVINGDIKRLIVNMPPSYTKTELVVIQFCSYAYTINPSCRFMHISGGDTLALDNSSKIKEQLFHPVYQRFWKLEERRDTRGKAFWKTDKNGVFYAVSAGGKITGFRAGRSKPGFQGAIIIDDPQKPDEMLSQVRRKSFIEKYKNTIKSRVDNRNTPIIVIMQRLHEEDFCDWLLGGGTGEMWHHLCLPTPIEA